jgi:hypothetical protein
MIQGAPPLETSPVIAPAEPRRRCRVLAIEPECDVEDIDSNRITATFALAAQQVGHSRPATSTFWS